ncbi:venom acid phosphatase Acph-1-like [Phymastichus coffea]|uniref:venom acid phosphatase Acph-1-like n=1 Tax=Phymastichus coffea TaxID=108790 RepID=UPI00273A9379|nr:venom acid phosphatase Acph-1-like [Phymastichus coffea]
MKLTLLLCTATTLQLATCVSTVQLSLELVQVLFRHGERTPQEDEAKFIPDSNQSLAGPWGYSQLTNVGKQQEYRLGQILREKYGDFLGDYRPEDVYAISSPFDRTKSSLALVLASLYPPEGELKWNEQLDWQPIPINFVPIKFDILFNSGQCHKYQQTYDYLMNSREMKMRVMEYSDIFAFLCRIYPDQQFNLAQLFFMNNFLNYLNFTGVELPSWYSTELHQRISKAALLYLDTLSYTPNLIRMNGGHMAKKWLKNLNINTNKPNPRKIYLFSGHEFTIYALAKAHDITLEQSPAFGSALVLEKLRDNDNKLFVRMFYMTGSGEEIPIKLYGFEYCPMHLYLKLLHSSLPTVEESRCLYQMKGSAELEKLLNTDTFSVSS